MRVFNNKWASRLVVVALSTLVIGYVGICVTMAVFQRTLLYRPSRFSLEYATNYASTHGLAPWVDATGEVIGWRLASNSSSVGSVLIAHGNGGSALGFAGLAESIQAATGLDPYLLEYPGYGHRGGVPCEATLLTAADEAWETLPTNAPAYVVSESLGTGIAAHLAQKYPTQVAGLLLFVPYDRLESVAQYQYPLLPAYFLLLDRFDPVDWLAGYHGPVKIVIAGKDEIVSPQRGQYLYDHYQGPKSLQVIPGAGHGGNTEQGPEWWRDVMGFWKASNFKIQTSEKLQTLTHQ